MKLEDVSIIVTSYNDADGIRRCLESVNGFGETLLVDAFSTDDTVEIAREFPVIIFRRVSQSAAEQKNWAAARTGAEWVLSLDANEALSRPLREEIEGLDGSHAVGFRARRSIEYLGKVIRSAPRRWARSTFLFAPSHGRFVQRGLHADIELDGKDGALGIIGGQYQFRVRGEIGIDIEDRRKGADRRVHTESFTRHNA